MTRTAAVSVARWPLPLALLLLAGVQAAVFLRVATPPPPLPAGAPASAFSAQRARTVLGRLLAEERPHPTGSEAGAAVVERLMAELDALGLEPQVQLALAEHPAGRFAPVRNVVAVVPGREEGPAVLLSVHHDSVPAGPGTADDGSGVACALEVARALLAGEPPRHAVILLFDEGEEAGLLGARAFAAEHRLAARVAVVVNLEARGTSGPSAMFRTAADARGDAWLLEAAGRSLPRPVTSSAIAALAKRLPNDTDLTVFGARGWPGVDFAFADGVSRYHTPRDDLAHLDLATLQHHGESALAAVRALADEPLELPRAGPPAPGATWYDVLGFGVVHAGPAGRRAWIRPIFLLAAAAVGMALGRRRGWLRARDVVAGAALAPSGVALAAAAGWLVTTAEKALAGSTAPWTASPGATSWALGLAALSGATCAAAQVASRRDPGGLLAGVVVVTLLAGAVTGVVEPGLSYLLTDPGAAGALGLLALALLRARRVADGPAQAALAALPGLIVAAVLHLELAYALHVMAGPGTFAAIVVPVAVAASWLGPFAGASSRGAVLAHAAVVLAAALACLGLAVRAPSFTADEPRHLSLVHRVDVARGEGSWLAERGDRDPLPASLLAAAPFEERVLALAPEGEGARLSAPAPAVPVARPTLGVLADERGPDGRRLRLSVAPGAEAFELSVILSRAPGLARLTVAGRDRPVSASQRQGWEAVTIAGPPAEGLALEVGLADDGQLDVVLIARYAALPEEAAPLLAARPPEAVPVHRGDHSLVVERLRM
jgi:hypothetical protein